MDFNYEITTHIFATPGLHTIHWEGGYLGNKSYFWINSFFPLESNTLTINVVK